MENTNGNNPSFVKSITDATNAAANYVNDSLNSLKEQKTQEIINTAETEKVILDINTEKFATSLNNYNNIVENYPIADGNLNAYDEASTNIKEELSKLTSQIYEALTAYIVAKKNDIQKQLDESKNPPSIGGKRKSKKHSKKNKKQKSKKHQR
jgi:hypothetical protein